MSLKPLDREIAHECKQKPLSSLCVYGSTSCKDCKCNSSASSSLTSSLRENIILDQDQNPVTNSYSINQGYPLSLLCTNINGDTVTWNFLNNEVQSLATLIASSFIPLNDGMRSLIEQIDAFRSLYRVDMGSISALTSYTNNENENETILPNSDIAGPYSCVSDSINGSMTNVIINVRNPSGSFSQFFIRSTSNLFNVSNVNNQEYQLAVLEANIFTRAVINGLNVSADPIRNISCYFVPLTASEASDEKLHRFECNLKEYPSSDSFRESVAPAITSLLSELGFQDTQTSDSGFCDHNQTTSSFGNHIWSESVGGSTSVQPCNGSNDTRAVIRMCQTNGDGWRDPDYSQCAEGGIGVTGTLVIVVPDSGAIENSAYTINEGYRFALLCATSNSREEPVWIGPNGNQIPDVAVFANSSFIIINGRRELNQGVSVLDFMRLFSFRTSEENSQGVFLTSYFNGLSSDSDFLLPDSNIGGTYMCMSGNQSQSVSVSLRRPTGMFSRFFFRFTGSISSTINVNDRDYQLAFIEANLLPVVVDGLNFSTDPIRTIACQFVPLSQFSSNGQDRFECDVREYPPNSSFVGDVGNRLSSVISNTIFHDIQLSNTGFCNFEETSTFPYGFFTWPETVVGSVARLQCSETTFATRACNNGATWGDPDFSQCNSGGGSRGSFSIFDLNRVSVRESYTINQGYIFGLRCGIFGGSVPKVDTFKWFDSNGNEVQNLTKFIDSSFRSTNEGTRLLNQGLSIADFKGLYSHRFINDFEFFDVAYLVSYVDFDREGELILPGTSISGTYTCRSSSGNYSQTISVNTRNPSGSFSQFFFRFTALFTNISVTDVEDKDYELAVIEANIFFEAVVRGFNSTIDPIRTMSCHFVP
uniref:Ig-like domain-containing protein n=1 Tax=Amphimedon queenslandica TaxID=400682 RepID=A0A1X7UBR3_AMPQE